MAQPEGAEQRPLTARLLSSTGIPPSGPGSVREVSLSSMTVTPCAPARTLITSMPVTAKSIDTGGGGSGVGGAMSPPPPPPQDTTAIAAHDAKKMLDRQVRGGWAHRTPGEGMR